MSITDHMCNWLDVSRNHSQSRRRTGRHSTRRRAMMLESLEDRRVMAATLAFTAPFELSITADPAGSRVYIHDLDPNNIPTNTQDFFVVVAASNDGTRSYSFHKSQIVKFNFTGSNYDDVYQASTGIGFGNAPVVHHVNALGGNDMITTGQFADTVYGGAGSDEIHGGGGDDTLEGGSSRDRIWGDSGNDTIRGDSGVDDLFGGRGNDTIHGGSDADWIEGQEDNDHLFGDSGTDFLYGGAGIDGLFGGFGADQLHGGTGADRFLFRTGETGIFQQTFGGSTISIADNILDDTIDDIRVRFTNEGARTVNWGPGVVPNTTSYTAGNWSDSDIKLVDQALGTIAEATRNNALLYKSSGDEPQMYRLGNASNQYVGFNDGAGDTHYSNQSFLWNGVFNADWAVQVVFHEIGHNWDTVAEAERLIWIWGGGTVNAFRAASGWTQTAPSDIWNYSKSRDNLWWYANDAEFVCGYAATNPQEDYAETFSAYFMELAERTFVGGDGADGARAKCQIVALGFRWHAAWEPAAVLSAPVAHRAILPLLLGVT